MMRHEELLQFFHDSAGRRLLSAYLPARSRDPAKRAEARTLFNAGVSRLRKSLEGAARDERGAFEAAVAHAREAFEDAPRPLEGEGIAIFASADRAEYIGPVHAPTPVAMAWREGAAVAPFLRALKHERPASLVLIDSRSARLYRFQSADLVLVAEFAAEVIEEAPSRMGEVPTGPFHHGTRGGTASDEIARREHAAFERMLAETVARLQGEAPADAWIIVGGIPRTASDLVAALPGARRAQAHLATHLTMQSREAELRAAVADVAASLTRDRDAALVATLLDRAGAGGRAAAGWPDCQRALAARAAHQVLVSTGFLEQSAGLAEDAARLALESGAAVEVVAGPGAERLDTVGGIAAALRFPLPTSPGDTLELAADH